MASYRKVSRKKGNGWQAIIRKQGLEPITKTFTRKTDAKKWANRIEADEEKCRALGNPKAAGKKCSHLIYNYLAQYTGKDPDRARMLSYWNERIGHIKVTDLTPDLIMNECDLLLGQPGKRCGKHRQRSGATVNRYRSALSAVFRLAIKHRNMPPNSNPCIGIPRGKEVSRFGRAASDVERVALLEAARQSTWSRLYLAVLMGFTTGARKSELLSLTWNDVDFNKRTALLSDTKNSSPRLLLLLEPVIQELKTLPRPLDSTTRLFPRKNDPHQPITDHEFYRYWNEAKAVAGVQDFRFHDCRHSAVSYLIEAGVPMVTVAAIAGHRSMTMVQRYSHLGTQHQLEVVENALAGKVR